MEIITVDLDGTPVEYVVIPIENGKQVIAKSIYDTLPSNSSTPQAGA
jgi:hypothetical protein